MQDRRFGDAGPVRGVRRASGGGLTLVFAALALVATSCGTRVERGSGPLHTTQAAVAPTSTDDGVLDSAPAEADSAGSSQPGAPASGGTVLARPAGEGSGDLAAPVASAARATETAPHGGKSAQTPPTSGALTKPSPGGAPVAPTPAAPGAAAGRSSIVLASVGIYGGVGGGTGIAVLQGAQLWVTAVNQRGGINGHPVRLLVYDNGADPARHRAQIQDAVERQHVIAFVANAEVLGGSRQSIEYLEAKRVPVLGGSTAEPWFYSSPMYFPQAASGAVGSYTSFASAAHQLVGAGKTKFGTVVCVESSQCTNVEQVGAESAKELGYDLVYQGKLSLGQPDFTAVCLSAKNAGVEALMPVSDWSTYQRVAAACARQGFKPAYFGLPAQPIDRWKADPSFGPFATPSNVFPYFQSGTRATDEFQEALKAHGSALPKSVLVALGWVAGKMLEKAAANVSEPPSTQNVLDGLWSFRNEALGDLTQPLTFVKDQPTTPIACWWNMATADGTWVSPDGFKRQCRALPEGLKKYLARP